MNASLSRREMFRALGALVVVAAAPSAALSVETKAALGKTMDPAALDAWLAVAPDGMVTAYFGKPDVGQGVDIAIAQIVAEELDLPVERVAVQLADTCLTPDQGGVSGSTGVQLGGATLRKISAEARRLLVEHAAEELQTPVEQLHVDGGVITAPNGTTLTYAELVKAGFDAKLDWNGKYGNGLVAGGKAKPKSPDQYRVVGTSPKRRDIPDKVFGKYSYSADYRPTGMLHGRSVRPPRAGAKLLSVNKASIASVPDSKVVHSGDFVGVVAKREWDAIRAAQMLKVTWSDTAAPFFPSENLFEHIRNTPPQKREVTKTIGQVDEALSSSVGKRIEAEYFWPFQSHASMGPACAVADVRADGVTLWNPSQKTHATAEGIAKMLGRPVQTVRSIFCQGPGSYGRNDAGDAVADAALMSLLVGKPVRAQGMRSDGNGWDPKGAASMHKVRAVVSPEGKIIGHDYLSKGFARMDVSTFEREPHDLLAGQQIGFVNKDPDLGFEALTDGYVIANRRIAWETIPRLMDGASPLRTSHLRDPLGMQLHFANESFVDECALAVGADPVSFRLDHVIEPRHRAVIEAAAKAANWEPGPPGSRRKVEGDLLTGIGFAYAPRGNSIVAIVSEVQVNKTTGSVWPRRFWVAHECGLIINPETLKRVIEGNIVHGTSRSLFEEVKFDADNVTSLDWVGYPILEIAHAPESIEIVLINRPDLPPSGAGEPATRPVAAALANAIYDATGARMRRVPFTGDRVKAALGA